MVRRLGWLMLAYLAGAGVGLLAFAPERVVAWWDAAQAYLFSTGSQLRQTEQQGNQQQAAPEPPEGRLDAGKFLLERPLKNMLVVRSSQVPHVAPDAVQQPGNETERPVLPRDLSKRTVEVPLRRLIADGTSSGRGTIGSAAQVSSPAVSEQATPTPDGTGPTRVSGEQARGATNGVNPPVEPGRVRWHQDFQTACHAAQRSGKPVLLFQLLGQLDQEFT